MKSLQRIWLLFRLLWKSGSGAGLDMQGGLFNARKKKKQGTWGKVSQYLLATFLVLYMGGMTGYLSWQMSPLLIEMGQDRFIFEMFMALFAIMTLVLGIFSTFSNLAFPTDHERLVVLPVKRGEILIARLTVMAVYQVFMPILMGVPLFAVYGYFKGMPWAFYLRIILALILQVLVPLSILVIVCLLLIRLTPLAKNKDRFMIISQLIVLVLVVYISMGPLNGGGDNYSLEHLNQLIAKPSLYQSLRLIVPNLDAWIDFMLLGGTASLLALGKGLAIALAFVVVSYAIANKLYRPEAGSESKRKQLKRGEMAKVLRPRSTFRSLLVRESKLVFRNPNLLTNYVLSNLVFIVIVPISLYMGLKKSGLELSLESIQAAVQEGFLNLPGFDLPIVIGLFSLILALLGSFVVGMASLNASALSRQGEEIYWSMTLPVSYSKQYAAQTLLAILLSATPHLVFILLLGLLLKLPALMILPPLVFFLWSAANSNLWPLLLDARKPLLDWENQFAAIKNSRNATIALVLNWVIAGIYGLTIYLYLKFWPSPWLILSGLAVFLALQTSYLLWAIPRTLQKTMGQIEKYL